MEKTHKENTIETNHTHESLILRKTMSLKLSIKEYLYTVSSSQKIP
jgi:hypothetical protein